MEKRTAVARKNRGGADLCVEHGLRRSRPHRQPHRRRARRTRIRVRTGPRPARTRHAVHRSGSRCRNRRRPACAGSPGLPLCVARTREPA
ncbi:hypothetical protein G6F58_013736 [Rhizopus delemar]|nr:hypothetical protein G6F58_013736 [Rhizopus delemar]